jgi:hypothetical protein
VAYPTCPGCREPQLVADEVVEYRCFSCGTQVRFFTCPDCGLSQAIPLSWQMFTCGRCKKAISVPRQLPYADRVKAARITEVGLTYPPQ